MPAKNCPFFAESAQSFADMARSYTLYELFWLWSLFSPMGSNSQFGPETINIISSFRQGCRNPATMDGKLVDYDGL